MEPALWVGPAIVAAFIAGLINVVGWNVTFRQARRLERERRAEKVTDVQTALLAEIRSDLRNLEQIDVADEIAAITWKLESAPEDQPYTPFVPKGSGAPVFTAIIAELSVLPTGVIDSVVLYHKQRETIGHFSEDLRDGSFRSLPKDRKLAIMEDYLRLKAHAAALAQDAVVALERSLGLAPSLNNRASVLSDRRSASAEVAASVQTSFHSDLSQYKSD